MTEEDKKAIEQMENSSGFIKYNRYQLKEVKKGKKVVMQASITEDSINPYGFAHGGFIFGLGDTAMGVAARSTGRKAVTLDSSITYLRPTKGNILKAIAEIIKDGKTTCFLRCNLYDENERLTATMDANYYYVD